MDPISVWAISRRDDAKVVQSNVVALDDTNVKPFRVDRRELTDDRVAD